MTMRNLCVTLAAAALLASAPPARAQIADALGRPLPVSSDPQGQVTVRVVDGDPSTPAAGLDVTLLVDGTPRVARTDASGRATFTGVAAGATAQVQVKGKQADQAEQVSQPVVIPPSGGVRVIMSTTGTFGGAAAAGAGAPAAASAGAMPAPRERSGQPIQLPGVPPDSLQVSVTYNDVKDPAANQAVYLVSYDSSEKVAVVRREADAQGKVTFSGLDLSGDTAYFVMSVLPRGAFFDRLLAGPVILPGQAGLALTLSGEKRYSTAAPIDDVLTVQRIERTAPPAGQVVVELQGGAEERGTVTMHDAATGQELGKGEIGSAVPAAAEISAESMFMARPDTPAGSVDVTVLGADGEPMDGVDIAVVAASLPALESPFAAETGAAKAVRSKTTSSGPVRVANVPAGQLIVVARIAGKEVRSDPFDVSKQGGAVGFQARWPRSWPSAVVDASAQPAGKIVYVQTQMSGKRFSSLPFQLAPDRGARATLVVMPRVMFHFSLTSAYEEDYFAFRGRLALHNSSWFPYRSDENGVLVPLPVGFKGAQTTEEDAVDVSPVPGQGLRFLRPLAPGVRSIVAGWSMPAKDGSIHWDLALPFGAFQSGMEIMQFPGMTVDLPPGVRGEVAKVAKGAFFVLPEVTILPNQRMVMTVRGLPSPPAWKTTAPRIAGVLVLLILFGGVVAAASWRRKDAAKASEPDPNEARQAKINALMDELIAMEGSADEARRQELMAQLEALWPKDGDKSKPRAAS